MILSHSYCADITCIYGGGVVEDSWHVAQASRVQCNGGWVLAADPGRLIRLETLLYRVAQVIPPFVYPPPPSTASLDLLLGCPLALPVAVLPLIHTPICILLPGDGLLIAL